MTNRTLLSRAILAACGPGATLVGDDQVELLNGTMLPLASIPGLAGHLAPLQAAAERLAQFPPLEPDRFWFMVRLSGYEQTIKDWVAGLANPGSEEAPNPAYDPVGAALISAKLEFAKHFERDHPFIVEAIAALGIPEAEIDALWQFAAFG